MKTIFIDGFEVPADEEWASVKERQKLQLEVLKSVIEKFESIGVEFFLAYGAVIGIARHGGHMIPWDDDVDLIMPRKDYEKAISALYKDQNFRCYEFSRDSDFRVKSAKVAIECRVQGENYEGEKSCYIDIFALDRVASLSAIRRVKLKLRILIENVVLYRNGLLEGWRRKVCQFLSFLFPKKANRLHRMMVRMTSLPSLNFLKWRRNTLVGEMYGAYGEKCLMKWNIYHGDGERKFATLEGIRVPVPYDVHSYLANIYGEWSKAPPIEKRRPTHTLDDPWFYSELKAQKEI
jgi:lipopolysaccharide cholinephosphotransferase